MKTKILILFLLTGPGAFAQQGMKLMTPMHETFSLLEEVKFTGDADSDFAKLMITHHKGGIAMLDEVITSGTNQEIIDLAKQMKESQEGEIKELEKFVSDGTQVHPGIEQGMLSDNDFVKEMKSHLENAKDEMSRNMSLTGNIDKDFATLMSMHHDHGIDMINTELRYGKNAELKQLAGRMLKENESEKKVLDELKGSEGMGKMRHESGDTASSSLH